MDSCPTMTFPTSSRRRPKPSCSASRTSGVCVCCSISAISLYIPLSLGQRQLLGTPAQVDVHILAELIAPRLEHSSPLFLQRELFDAFIVRVERYGMLGHAPLQFDDMVG